MHLVSLLLAIALPYSTAIAVGDGAADTYLYGDSVVMGQRETTWVFHDVKTFDEFYEVEGDMKCDSVCIKTLVHQYSPNVHAVPIGSRVNVLKVIDDPVTPGVRICKVSGEANGWIICIALKNPPG